MPCACGSDVILTALAADYWRDKGEAPRCTGCIMRTLTELRA